MSQLAWVKLSDRKPPSGALVILTDGKARWMALYEPKFKTWRRWQDTTEHVATHWHPIADPHDINS